MLTGGVRLKDQSQSYVHVGVHFQTAVYWHHQLVYQTRPPPSGHHSKLFIFFLALFPEGKTSVEIQKWETLHELKSPIMIIQYCDDHLKIFSQITHKSTWSKCTIATKLSKQQNNKESIHYIYILSRCLLNIAIYSRRMTTFSITSIINPTNYISQLPTNIYQKMLFARLRRWTKGAALTFLEEQRNVF